MKKTASFLAALSLGLTCGGDAAAWEGVCRYDTPQWVGGRYMMDYVNSICGLADPPDPQSECKTAFDKARNVDLGEHGYIARMALHWAGLDELANEALPDYYVDGQNAFTDLPSLTPAGIGAPKKVLIDSSGYSTKLHRNVFLSDLAEVSDDSYSFSDFLMANEHCLAQNVDRSSKDDIEACHTYNSHVAIVNSTHFAPQSQHMYWLYHELARERAQRCKKMIDALDAPAGWVLEDDDKLYYARSCEVEALALQSIATHFLSDAWSAGHMWERWGSPLYPQGAEAQYQAIIVGAVSGLIHGWRSVARESGVLRGSQHDQLCMPGPFASGAPAVQFDQPSLPGVQNAAGDLYLLPCTAQKPDFDPPGPPGWAVAPGELGDPMSQAFGTDTVKRPLSPQYHRMMTCVTLGYTEVYDEGPKTIGDLAPGVSADQLEPRIKSSMSASCWDQRVTNQSMLLGAGINNTSFGAPGFLAHTSIGAIPYIAEDKGNPGDVAQVFDVIKGIAGNDGVDMRVDLVRVFDSIAATLHDKGPNDLTAASLPLLKRQPPPPGPTDENKTLEFFHGSSRNSDNAKLIDDEKVGYLEPHASISLDGTPKTGNPNAWHAKRGPACNPGTGDVTGDAQCPDGYYCDRAIPVGMGVAAGHWCVRHETAILRVFRDAEMPAWCGDDTLDDLDAARAACKASSKDASDDSDACDDCERAIFIHLRNACDAYDFSRKKSAGVLDPRSVCDVLQDASILADPSADLNQSAVYVPFDPDEIGAAQSTARNLCRADSLPTDPGADTTQLPPFLSANYDGVCARGCGKCTWCWGLSEVGDFGPFTSPSSNSIFYPEPTGLSEVTAVSTGAQHTCAIAKGGIYCWGSNASGQLGDGTLVDHRTPQLVKGLGGADDIALGWDDSCALVGGDVWCWGGNETYQLGNGTMNPALTPIPVSFPEKISQISPGIGVICAVGAGTGQVYCVGQSVATFGLYVSPPPDGKSPTAVLMSVDVTTNTGTPITGATQVATGGDYNGYPAYACALVGGQVFCWGGVPAGATYAGSDTTNEYLAPVVLPELATQVSVGPVHICALLESGTVACWGEESNGEIGDGNSFFDGVPPTVVPGLFDVARIAAGDEVSCAQKTDGSVYCWGGTNDGQLGAGTSIGNSLTPVKAGVACP